MTAAVATAGGGDSSAEYEELRTHVLTGSTAGSHAGLVLLLRQGVAAWMARRSAGSASVRPAAHPARRMATPLFSDEIQTGLVQVMASIALAGKQEVRT